MIFVAVAIDRDPIFWERRNRGLLRVCHSNRSHAANVNQRDKRDPAPGTERVAGVFLFQIHNRSVLD